MADKTLGTWDLPELSGNPSAPGTGFMRLFAQNGLVLAMASNGAIYDLTRDVMPIGTVQPYRFSDVPDRFLALDGATYDVNDYPVLGAKYGGVPGGTFTVDDWRDVPIYGSGALNPGALTGSNTVDLAHSHTISHTHQIDPPPTVTSGPNQTAATNTPLVNGASATHDHTVDIPPFISGAASVGVSGSNLGIVDKRPRRAIAQWIIRAK